MKNVLGTVSILVVLLSMGIRPENGRSAAADDAAPAAGAPKMIEIKQCLIKAVKSATLATDRPGVIAAVEPKEGDPVHEGQVLARLMDDVAQANLDVAKLTADDNVEIEYAAKLNAVDAIEYEKAVKTNERQPNTVTDMELRRKKLDEERSRLQIQKAQHDKAVNAMKVKQAEAELKTYRIVAPFDGIVTQVDKSRGEAVKQGDAILEVINTDFVRVEGYVLESDVWSVKVGSPCTIRLDVRGADLEVEKKVVRGRVGFVDVGSNAANHWTRVWAEVPNPGNLLRPGLNARMTITPAAPATAGAPAGAPPAAPLADGVK